MKAWYPRQFVCLGLSFWMTVGVFAQQRPDNASLVLEQRIGSVDDTLSAFGWVQDIAVATSGAVYVLLRFEKCVRVFSANGEFFRDIGRRGAGPGEFRDPIAMGWKQDTLWVYDSGLRRFSLFSPAGEFVRSWQSSVPGATSLVTDGMVVIAPQGYSASHQFGGLNPIVLYREDMRPVDTLANILDPGRAFTIQISHGGRTIHTLNPFPRAAYWRVAADGNSVVTAVVPLEDVGTSHFILTKARILGDTVFSKQFQYQPQPINGRIEELAVNEVLQGLAGGPNPPPVTELAVVRSLDIPEHLPPITGLAVGKDGTIWLRREDPYQETVAWDVFDGIGNYMLTVQTPRNVQIRWAEAHNVWGIEADATGVHRVARYRVGGL